MLPYVKWGDLVQALLVWAWRREGTDIFNQVGYWHFYFRAEESTSYTSLLFTPLLVDQHGSLWQYHTDIICIIK